MYKMFTSVLSEMIDTQYIKFAFFFHLSEFSFNAFKLDARCLRGPSQGFYSWMFDGVMSYNFPV